MTELFRHVRLTAKTNYFSFCIWAQAAHVLLVKEPKLLAVGQKGVIFIAIYHFEAKMISRGIGRSAAAAAAYASCSRIYNDYDGVQHDYTRKQGCVYSEVFLPPNAPEEWKDRAELWNAVETAEKSKDSRLARELIVALPIEVGIDEWKASRHCCSANIPIISVHGLRHTHASLLLFAGVSIASVARRLGHASMTTTQKTYLHIIQELESKDVDLVMRSLSGLT